MAPRRRHDLALVAATYREAIANSARTTDAVMAATGCTYPAAGKLVMRARAAGLLPPTSQGCKTDGSEHHPTIAVIHRNHPSEHKFHVCERCLTPWPCAEAS